MKPLTTAALVLASSCVTPLTIECSSRCGTQVITLPGMEHMPDPQGSLWTCETLQMAEDKLLPLVVEKYPKACEQMRIQVAFHPGPYWEWNSKRIGGLAHCQLGVIEIASNVIYESSYAHEVLHILQACNAKQPNDDGMDNDHADWKRNGFLDIISKWKADMREELE